MAELDKSVDELIADISNPDPAIRRDAAASLAEATGPEVFAALERALSADRDPTVRALAAEALGATGDIDALTPLVAARDSHEPEVRAAVAMALGRTQDPRAVDAVIGMLADGSPAVRRWAAWALGALGDPDALDAVEDAEKFDDDTDVRIVASYAAEKLRDAKAARKPPPPDPEPSLASARLDLVVAGVSTVDVPQEHTVASADGRLEAVVWVSDEQTRVQVLGSSRAWDGWLCGIRYGPADGGPSARVLVPLHWDDQLGLIGEAPLGHPPDSMAITVSEPLDPARLPAMWLAAVGPSASNSDYFRDRQTWASVARKPAVPPAIRTTIADNLPEDVRPDSARAIALLSAAGERSAADAAALWLPACRQAVESGDAGFLEPHLPGRPASAPLDLLSGPWAAPDHPLAAAQAIAAMAHALMAHRDETAAAQLLAAVGEWMHTTGRDTGPTVAADVVVPGGTQRTTPIDLAADVLAHLARAQPDVEHGPIRDLLHYLTGADDGWSVPTEAGALLAEAERATVSVVTVQACSGTGAFYRDPTSHALEDEAEAAPAAIAAAWAHIQSMYPTTGLDVRWALWPAGPTTGAPIGMALAVALARCLGPPAPSTHEPWAFTGAIDASGRALSTPVSAGALAAARDLGLRVVVPMIDLADARAAAGDGAQIFGVTDLAEALAVTAPRVPPTVTGATVRAVIDTADATDEAPSIRVVAVRADGRRAVTGHAGQVAVWDLASGNAHLTLGTASPVTAAAFLAGGGIAFALANNASLRVWDPATGAVRELLGRTGPITSIASAGEARAVTASTDGAVRVWDLRSGSAQVLAGQGSTVAAVAVAVATSGHFAACGDTDGNLLIWRLADGGLVHTLAAHEGPIVALALSDDGSTALSVALDGEPRAWDIRTGAMCASMTELDDPAIAVAIGPGGRSGLTASKDSTIRAWDLTTGRCRRLVTGDVGWIAAVAFTPDGQLALTAGYDHRLRVWDLLA